MYWLLLLLMTFSSVIIKAEEIPWTEKKAEGWVYFEDKKKKKQALEEEKKREQCNLPKRKNKTKKQVSNREKLKKIREDLEEKLATAILIPTIENIKAYIIAQQKITKQSELFAYNWQKVILSNPNLDPSFQNPTNQYGLAIKKNIDNQKREKDLKKLGKENFLLFFYDTKSPFSHGMAAILKDFAKENNWILLGVSIDGKEFEGINTIKNGQKLIQEYEITHVPAIFVMNPSKKETKPTGWGVITLNQLEDNILSQLKGEL